MAEKKLSKAEQLNNELMEIDISHRKRMTDFELGSIKQEELRRAIEVSINALHRLPALQGTNVAGDKDIVDSGKVLTSLLVSATRKLQAEIDGFPPMT